ncbi:phenylalanine--tRNA ligase beta subunit-related protein, partial [Rhizobium johnstonii]|uniref:phenylalanine--tRNA ligase beta subunit-related protein n=1 Tax=Rhizobium johnstonii TaxID=3019933 RepID=UPI003F9AC4DA
RKRRSSASEAQRYCVGFSQEHALPRLNPLIDLCNAISLAFAITIAVFDTEKIAGDLEVRRAKGDETYLTFGGESE